MLERGRRLTVRARAKVNLGLEVLSRRADGYHELLTVLSPVDLADGVILETTEGSGPGGGGIEVSCETPGVPLGADNLVWRAADLLRREAGVAAGARIRIVKAIPIAAGLGGGSADAAAVLVGLGRLWRLSLSAARWRALATALGMDVPFFLGDGPALGSGRGERLGAVPPHGPIPLVLVSPGFPLTTGEVYGRLEPGDFTDGAAVRGLVAALPSGPRAIAARLYNGLERPAARLWPGLAEVKTALLEAGALGAVMSGSGPTVVGVAASSAAARRIESALTARPWRCWATRSVAGPALSVVPGGAAGEAKRRVASWGVAKR